MLSLKDAIIQTIAYFDLFEYAPTLLDIERWLLKTDESHTLSNIRRALKNDLRIQQCEGLYILRGREALTQTRKHKYTWTEQKWKRTKRYIRLLASMPYVEGIFLVNSMGWHNARQSSDIDLLIVTTPGHIWSARFWTTVAMKLLRQRPHEQANERALCLSLYVAADRLNLEPYRLSKADIHYTFWVNQCYPLYDSGQYTQFTHENGWIRDTFSNIRWASQSERRTITLSRVERMLQYVRRIACNEWLLKKIQLHILPEKLRTLANTDQRVVMNEHILKLHTNDTREQRQHDWAERVNTLQQHA